LTNKKWYFWLAKFGIFGKNFDEICTFDEQKMAFLAAKSFGLFRCQLQM